MKPAPFDYVAPTTVADCIAALEDNDEARILAGGQSLLPLLAMRVSTPARLVDITRVAALRGTRIEAHGPVTVGAAVRQAELEDHPALALGNPLVAEALPHIGHRPIRNRGTVGGSVAHADPAAEWPALLVTLEAVATVAGRRGTRDIPAANLYEGPYTTALEPGEVLTHVTLPTWPSTRAGVCREIGRRSGDLAMVGAMVTVETADGVPRWVAVTAFGGLPRPLRLHALEDRLIGLERPQWATAIDEEIAALPWRDDVHASRGLRVHVGSRLMHTALAAAVDDATSREGLA